MEKHESMGNERNEERKVRPESSRSCQVCALQTTGGGGGRRDFSKKQNFLEMGKSGIFRVQVLPGRKEVICESTSRSRLLNSTNGK